MLLNNKGNSNNNNEAAGKSMECAVTVENSIEFVDLVDTTNTNLSNLQPEIPFAVSNCNVLQSVLIIAETEKELKPINVTIDVENIADIERNKDRLESQGRDNNTAFENCSGVQWSPHAQLRK